MSEIAEQIWKRQTHEPAKWYACFEIYLSLGPERTVHRAFANVPSERNSQTRRRAPAERYRSWANAAKQWQWVERANAWDEYDRRQLARRDEQRRSDEREARLKIISQQLQAAESALLACRLDTLTPNEARRLLPTIRLLLRDMLEQQRIDLKPLPAAETYEQQELIPITADELVETTRHLAKDVSWRLGTRGDLLG